MRNYDNVVLKRFSRAWSFSRHPPVLDPKKKKKYRRHAANA
jgi:hypothetical protein